MDYFNDYLIDIGQKGEDRGVDVPRPKGPDQAVIEGRGGIVLSQLKKCSKSVVP